MQAPTLVVLGTGGTIAGTAADPADHVGYTAGQIGVERLLGGVPVPAGFAVEVEQVAQLDSKDMDVMTWRTLALRAEHHLARAGVAGVVVTHGTDTLEETATLLQRVLAPARPLVLTAAMRPATSAETDGPANLRDALVVAADRRARGVLVVVAGRVHAGAELRKHHSQARDAFVSGEGGALAEVAAGRIDWRRAPPGGAALGTARLPDDARAWPRVEIVTSHAGASAAMGRALVDGGVDGLVVAATGNGTVHRDLLGALLDAQKAGVAVLRASRCAEGGIVAGGDDRLPSAGARTPVQARVVLLLSLLGSRARAV